MPLTLLLTNARVSVRGDAPDVTARVPIARLALAMEVCDMVNQ